MMTDMITTLYSRGQPVIGRTSIQTDSLMEIQEGITSAKGDLFRTLHLILNPMR